MRKIRNWLKSKDPIPSASKVLYSGSICYDSTSPDEEIIYFNSFSSAPSYSFVTSTRFRVTFPENFPVGDGLQSILVLFNLAETYTSAAVTTFPTYLSVGANYLDFQLANVIGNTKIDLDTTYISFSFKVLKI